MGITFIVTVLSAMIGMLGIAIWTLVDMIRFDIENERWLKKHPIEEDKKASE